MGNSGAGYVTGVPLGGAMEQERKRKRVFWLTFVGSYVGLSLANLAASFLLWAMQPRRAMPWMPLPEPCLFMYLPLAWLIAGLVCRLRGLSMEGHTSEVLKQSGPARDLGTKGAVAVPGFRWPWLLAGALLTVMAARIGTSAVRAGGMSVGTGCAIASPFILAALLCWGLWFARRRAVATVDDQGILKRSLWSSDERISWDQIAEVTVGTARNVFGRPDNTVCRISDAAGQTLLTISLQLVPEDARDRFIEAIRAKQGLPPGKRTELEAAPAPAGTGLEPEAAPVPAGRGTELTAAALHGTRGTEPGTGIAQHEPTPPRRVEPPASSGGG